MTIESRTEAIGSPRQVLRIDSHTLHADLSAAAGGGSAPDPHDYFDAALAAGKALASPLRHRHGHVSVRGRVVIYLDMYSCGCPYRVTRPARLSNHASSEKRPPPISPRVATTSV